MPPPVALDTNLGTDKIKEYSRKLNRVGICFLQYYGHCKDDITYRYGKRKEKINICQLN